MFCFKISNLIISNQIHATKQKLHFNINGISKQIFCIKEFSSRLSDMKQKALSESKRNEINANTNKIFYFHFLLWNGPWRAIKQKSHASVNAACWKRGRKEGLFNQMFLPKATTIEKLNSVELKYTLQHFFLSLKRIFLNASP